MVVMFPPRAVPSMPANLVRAATGRLRKYSLCSIARSGKFKPVEQAPVEQAAWHRPLRLQLCAPGYGSSTVLPVVFRASRSRCACATSASG
jgi:hypothetical protein